MLSVLQLCLALGEIYHLLTLQSQGTRLYNASVSYAIEFGCAHGVVTLLDNPFQDSQRSALAGLRLATGRLLTDLASGCSLFIRHY